MLGMDNRATRASKAKMNKGFLKNLKDISVLVVHPQDRDGAFLVEHLERMGCTVEARWPVPDTLLGNVDIAFVAVDREHHATLKPYLKKLEDAGAAIIAVVDYENPATLQLVFDINALSVIGKPVRAFGLLTNLMVSHKLLTERRGLEAKLRRLEKRLVSQKNISAAIMLMMQMRQISEQDAYALLREQAMSRRTSIEKVAGSLIEANDLLNFRKPAK